MPIEPENGADVPAGQAVPLRQADPGGRQGEPGETYASAGVSIDAGEETVRRIGPLVASTRRPEVLGGLGGFGGLFAFPTDKYTNPLLVSTTDGVGTKSEVARMMGRFDTIGIDLVAMCVDDLVCCGAEPLFFLDYLAIGRLDPDQVEQLVAGIAEGCRRAGCALVGGEMAEHPGVMDPDQFDMAGFAVGVVERDRLLDPSRVTPGDALVGLESPGLRSNGFSLARRLMFERAGLSAEDPAWNTEPGSLEAPSVGDLLLTPSVIYAPAVLAALESAEVHAVAHITGGGLPGNLPRVLGPTTDAVIDLDAWEPGRLFSEMQAIGSVSDDEMRRVFNMGIGMVMAVPPAEMQDVISTLADHEVRGTVIGEIAPGKGGVRFVSTKNLADD